MWEDVKRCDSPSISHLIIPILRYYKQAALQASSEDYSQTALLTNICQSLDVDLFFIFLFIFFPQAFM